MRNPCCVLKAVIWLLVSIQVQGENRAASDGSRGTFHSAAAIAVNDLFANALKVNAQPLWIHTTSNQGASMEPGEALLRHGGDANAAASLWYTWSVRERAELLVDTAGSGFATAIGVYTGNSIASLVAVAGSSSVVQGRDAWVRFVAEPNVSYKIAVAGIPPTQLGSATIRFEVEGRPDLLPPLMEISRPASGSTVREARARIEGVAFDPQPNGSGVREVQFTLQIEGDSILHVAQGTTNFSVSVDLAVGANGVTFWAVDNADNRSELRRLTLLYSPTTVTNDLFVDRIVLDTRATARTDSNAGATREMGEPAHAGNPGGASIWYEYRADASGVLLLSTAGSSFDTVLAVYEAGGTIEPAVTNLIEVASSDDVPGGGGYSELLLAVEQGKKYFVAVDGFDNRFGTVQLTYRFNASAVFRLTVLPSIGEGTVAPSGGAYPENATVSLLARPADGWVFDFFETASGAVRQNPFVVLMNRDASVRAVFRPRPYAEDFEGGFNFLFESAAWSIQRDPTNSANHVLAFSANDMPRSTNIVSLTLQVADGIGGFDFGVSSETNYDRLEFFVGYLQGGTVVSRSLLKAWSGEARGRYEFALRAGIVTLEWRYSKDAAISDGTDSVFIDNLDVPLFSIAPVLSVSEETVSVRLPGVGGQSLRVETSPDLQTWSFLRMAVGDGSGEVKFSEEAAGRARFYRFIPAQNQ